MLCSNCSKPLSDVAAICPYCGTAVNASSAIASRSAGSDDTQNILIDRMYRNKHRRAVLPQDERMRKIISDFEIKTDVIYIPPPTLRVYQAPHTNYSGRPYTADSISTAKIIKNILLSLLLPPVGLIRSIFLIKKGGPVKKLGLVMLVLSILLILGLAIAISILKINFFQ